MAVGCDCVNPWPSFIFFMQHYYKRKYTCLLKNVLFSRFSSFLSNAYSNVSSAVLISGPRVLPP